MSTKACMVVANKIYCLAQPQCLFHSRQIFEWPKKDMGISDPGTIRSLGKDKVRFVAHLITDCGVTQGHSRLLIPFPR